MQLVKNDEMVVAPVECVSGWLVVLTPRILVNQCQSGDQTQDTHTSGNSVETLL